MDLELPLYRQLKSINLQLETLSNIFNRFGTIDCILLCISLSKVMLDARVYY